MRKETWRRWSLRLFRRMPFQKKFTLNQKTTTSESPKSRPCFSKICKSRLWCAAKTTNSFSRTRKFRRSTKRNSFLKTSEPKRSQPQRMKNQLESWICMRILGNQTRKHVIYW